MPNCMINSGNSGNIQISVQVLSTRALAGTVSFVFVQVRQRGFPCGIVVKILPSMQERQV